MPKANLLNTIGPALSATGRRSLFAAAPALAFALASPALAAADPNADSELIRLCGEFQRAHDGSHAAVNDDDAENEAAVWKLLMDERSRFGDLIDTVPAVTPAGQRAKARIALLLLEEAEPWYQCSDYSRMIHSVLVDVAGSAGA